MSSINKIAVIMLNWNGKDDSLACIKAMQGQSEDHVLVVVDNNSSDGLVDIIKKDYPNIVLLVNSKNRGFAGGVNTGLRYALENGFTYAALINNDATPEKSWLAELTKVVDAQKGAGIVAGKLLKTDGTIDSTGDVYTSWGLAFPRGRTELDTGQYDQQEFVFAASGGASLYRLSMLEQIGLFDEDFFAYYEDVDVSFRAQLAGWKVIYTPRAVAHHKIGGTSAKIPGFTTYHAVKNLPWLLWKNVPLRLLPTIWVRFAIAHTTVIVSGIKQGKIIPVIKGVFMAFLLFPKKLVQRRRIQSNKKVDADYIKLIMMYDLPPNATKLRKIRDTLRSLRFWR